MKYLLWFVRFVVFVVLLGFAFKNTDPVAVRFYLGGEWDAPLVIPLNSELYADFAELRREREKQDVSIIDYVNGLSEDRIAGDVSYATTSGAPNVMRLGTILQHFFNHQTHHRGQVHDMLSQTNVAPPPLDLLYYVREVPEAG